MTRSSLQTLLPHARDHELRAGRWLLAVVVTLGLLHAFVVTPFLAIGERRSAMRVERDRLATVAGELAALAPHVAGSRLAVDEVMTPALERLDDDVRGDLVRLRATYDWLLSFVATQRGESGDEEAVVSDVEIFRVENVDRILAVADAGTAEELLAALAPVAERHVVHPRFSDLQALWTSTALPRVEASLDAVAGSVPDLRGRAAGTDPAAWDALGTALASARRTARDLEWQPPERQGWWTSAPPAAGELLSMRLDPAVAEQLRRPLALDQLQVALARVDEAYRAVVDGLERYRETLAAGAGDGLASRRETELFVRGFPLVLGLALAAALFTSSRRRRELGLVVHLLAARGADVTGWYDRRSGWGLDAGLPDGTRTRAKRLAVLRSVALAVLGFGWLGLAAHQLRSLEPREHLVAFTSIGAAALLAAVIYDVSVGLGIERLLAREASEPPIERGFEAIDEEADVLDGHTLRR